MEPTPEAKFVLTCPGCQKRFQLLNNAILGKRVTCKSCKAPFLVDGSVLTEFAEKDLPKPKEPVEEHPVSKTTTENSSSIKKQSQRFLVTIGVVGCMTFFVFVGMVMYMMRPNSTVAEKPKLAREEPMAVVPQENQPEVRLQKRNLRVKESYVVQMMNVQIPNRYKYDFSFEDASEDMRIYSDFKSKVRVVTIGEKDNLQFVAVAMKLEDFLRMDNDQERLRMFINSGNRMVLAVAPSISEEADGWLDKHAVDSILAKDPIRTRLGGFELMIKTQHKPEPAMISYMISSED